MSFTVFQRAMDYRVSNPKIKHVQYPLPEVVLDYCEMPQLAHHHTDKPNALLRASPMPIVPL